MDQPRSPMWPRAERKHLKLQPCCQACTPGTGLEFKVQVHHIFPFHYAVALGRADLELDDRNLITLCETEAGHPADNHHLLVGHLGDFKQGNLTVKQDCTIYQGLKPEQIQAKEEWNLEKKLGRIKDLDVMTDKEKKELRKLMDTTFPLEKNNGLA